MKNTVKIMVIDGSITMYLALKQWFAQTNLVFVHSSPFIAMDNISIKKPDVIILNIIQSKSYKIQLLKEIKKSKKYSSIPVIVVSESAVPFYVDEAFSHGAFDYLIKPIDLN